MAGVRGVVYYGGEMAGVRHVSGVLLFLYGSEVAGGRGVVYYGGEMADVRHVSGVLFSMVVRWQVSGRHVSGVLFSMVVRWQVSGMFQECCSL